MLDLNCDLGEGEPAERTRELMRQVSSANVACGGHAGDAVSMAHCVRLALELGVRLGAHPGPASRGDFGRSAMQPTAQQLTDWLTGQTGALAEIARAHGVELHHIKLHGALYHAAESDPALAEAYVEAVRRSFPGARIYSRSGGLVARTARAGGVEVLEELFADRAYQADGQLVPRSAAGAVLHDPAQVTARLRRWLQTGEMATVDGGSVRLAGQTLCVHGDTEGATALIRAIRELL